MDELSLRWKLFRIVCIIQFILTGFLLAGSVINLFTAFDKGFTLFQTISYTAVFWFLFLGQTILSENYPDRALSDSQKKKYNWLFLFNCIAIIVFSAHTIHEWKQVVPLLLSYKISLFRYLMLDPMPALYSITFLFHLVFMAGMFLLRVEIHRQSQIRLQSSINDLGNA